MDQSKFDFELKEYKRSKETMMSPLVRARLDETYAALPEMSRDRKVQRSRKAPYVAAAAVILGATVFTSGFISPVMAQSIKQIPVVGSLFSLIEADLGLRAAGEQGLSSKVNKSISHQDMKLEVTETVFDGTRAVYLLSVTAPNLKDGMFDTGKEVVKLSDAIENVTFSIDGKGQDAPDSLVSGGGFFSSAGESHPNMLVFEEILKTPDHNSTGKIPDSFQAEVVVKLAGIDQTFKLDIPFQKATSNTIQLKPNAVQSNDGISFEVSEVNVTPVTTRLLYSVKLDGETSDKSIRAALFDDQGRQLTSLHGEGEQRKDSTLTFDARYASEQGQPKYFIIKPFVVKDHFAETVTDDQFIKGLEIKVDLPEQNK
ncbi:DUF4179 domain-containing protein [Brevibacillus sp. M2.1A]|uniref:DUF4179 domain-containing protein n=1 Tax=Brevibacillus TaxID=55080 RepID=UPI00156A7456|nr:MULTISPECIES: DUF4179 domain-containing protein [Brevibacillus]MCC8437680.1 DUF4179 domain-containing protein [Brevibacillus sp. M2.1A]MCE0452914.1 DUF4179 domain-containing protein [Brevibacillus sp. AF8]UKK99803.1 DUF4179 domain-containing protein [Brevibacillus brevis]